MKLEDLKVDNKMVLNAPQRRALELAGIPTVELLATTTKRELLELSGFAEASVEKALQAALSAVAPNPFMSALDLYRQRSETVEMLTTGSKSFDALLGGGVETGSITELSGGYGSGKTQTVHQLCVNVQLPRERGGLGGGALVFDTEGTFRGDRALGMGLALGFEGQDVLKKIIVARCFSSDHQIMLLNRADPVIRENGVRLILVDSLIAHFRSEYVGREVLAPRQQALNQYLSRLAAIAGLSNVAVVVTNQVVDSPGLFSAPKPTGGNIVGHASVTRIGIRRPNKKKEERIVQLIESPWRPMGEAVFKITESGVEDVT